MVERFGTVWKRRGLKVNVDKSNVMVVSEDSPQCEVMLDGEQLEQVSEFKYLGYMLDARNRVGKKTVFFKSCFFQEKNMFFSCFFRFFQFFSFFSLNVFLKYKEG